MATRIRAAEKQANLPMEGAETPIKAEGFNHLHINVRDLSRSIRFYREAFGLKVGFSAGKDLIFMVPQTEGTHWHCTRLDRMSLSVWRVDSSTLGSSWTSTITIGWSSRSNRQVASWSRAASTAVDSRTHTSPIPTVT